MSPTLQLFSADAFSPYGEVLNLFAPAQQTINQGTSGRLNLPGGLDLAGDEGQAVLAVFHAQAQNPEGPCHMLERHQRGSQTFVPLTGARCRLLVALGQDQPDLRTRDRLLVRNDRQGFERGRRQPGGLVSVCFAPATFVLPCWPMPVSASATSAT